MASLFNEETQENPIVRAINRRLARIGENDLFWESEADRLVSRSALVKDADTVELVMTRKQFTDIFSDSLDSGWT
jgi:hypothetical protein